MMASLCAPLLKRFNGWSVSVCSACDACQETRAAQERTGVSRCNQARVSRRYQAGGLEAISRWLSEATPPEHETRLAHPGGVQARFALRPAVRFSCLPLAHLQGAVLFRSPVPVVSLRSTTG